MINLVPITGTFMGILGGYYLYLSARVIKERVRLQISVGDGTSNVVNALIASQKSGLPIDEKELPKKYTDLVGAIRSHANFGEYVPMVGVLALILELHGANPLFLKTMLGLFTAARVLHVEFGMKAKNYLRWGRVTGTMITFTTIALSSIGCIYLSNEHTFKALLKH
ncbi:hypothetical protein CYY_002394 [Polysphondylium violaceum]|uniref:Glutathione S-transferase n=1 Tax=Polysphondylium violaceum TaxID=133409 RepID=A0A8J4Q062_9MYCE|nr:hypothetical protein CYY_002394 [Polysphondylium violaceum]